MLRYTWSPQWWGSSASGADRPNWIDPRTGRLSLALVVILGTSLLIALATGVLAPGAGPTTSSELATAHSPTDLVLTYAVGWRGPSEDPPLVLPSGQSIKSSSYRGVPIDGVSYYYNLAPLPSFDPLARGQVTMQQIQVVAVIGDPPRRVMIYTIPGEGLGEAGSRG